MMERAGLPPRPGDCSLFKLLMITLILPVVAALFAAVVFPDRSSVVVAPENTAMMTMRGLAR